MSQQSFFTEIRNARIERILATKQSRILTSAWMRRMLSILTVVSSYALLATLLIPTPYIISKTKRIYIDSEAIDKNWIYDFRDLTQGAAFLLLIWSFALLRMSMRRVTLLPDEYLDELQVVNRDWAFKTGYLVVRRIGLAVAVLFGLLASVGQYIAFYSLGFKSSYEGPKLYRALERYVSDLSMQDPLGFYFKGFTLLAFVAYSFPIILLAWREARFPETLPEVISTKELTEKQSNAKFYFGALRLLVIFFFCFVSIWFVPKVVIVFGGLFYLFLIPLIYLVIPGSLMLFVWASVTTAGGISRARRVGFSSDLQKHWANIATAFLGLTLVLGIIVGSTMVLTLSGAAYLPGFAGALPFALIAGVLMIPAQAVSITFYAKLDSK